MISESGLLDGDSYDWLKGYSLASILMASFDYHYAHPEKVSEQLGKQES